ncbi:MAG: hypothetical protein HY000_39815, partial [Planctomycetes bacterium]|nr:hypothetical protein [Planctomycetota bacterium]
WIRNGLPRGEGTFKPTRQWVEGWNIGTPDHVFELPKYTVADTVDEEIKEFDVLTEFPNDRWIVAAEARPGNESVVRSIEASPLGTYQPGNSHVLYAAGTGRLLKEGQNVRALVHYAKAKGLAASDQSKLAVVFARDSMPRKNILEHPMVAPEFTIPAGTANFEVQARFEFPADGQIISLMPVMNLRGKDVYYRAIFPDATAKPLLSIPAWDPNWKYCYQLKSPLAAPKGTIVQAVAHFDNSDANVRNPDPAVAVNSGIGGEVFEGWIGYWIAEQE